MGRTEIPDLKRLRASRGWYGTYSHESEMALFSECMLECARKCLTGVGIVREAMLHQLRTATPCWVLHLWSAMAVVLRLAVVPPRQNESKAAHKHCSHAKLLPVSRV